MGDLPWNIKNREILKNQLYFQKSTKSYIYKTENEIWFPLFYPVTYSSFKPFSAWTQLVRIHRTEHMAALISPSLVSYWNHATNVKKKSNTGNSFEKLRHTNHCEQHGLLNTAKESSLYRNNKRWLKWIIDEHLKVLWFLRCSKRSWKDLLLRF